MIKKENLSDKMKNEAVSLGLCAQWTAEWQDNTSKDDMVEKFVRGIDFCIGRNWPLAKDIKKYFGDVIHNHGVYVTRMSIYVIQRWSSLMANVLRILPMTGWIAERYM